MVEEFIDLGTKLQIGILFRKKSRADCNQGIFAIIRFRIFYLPVSFTKIERLRYKEL
jgi:hypothetical protein